MASLSHILSAPLRYLAETPAQLFPWVPVFLAIGIGMWFSLAVEPGFTFYQQALVVLCGCIAVRVWGREILHPVAVAGACVALGVLAAGARAHMQASPMLDFRYYGPVEGRIVGIDRSQSDKLRLTLDQVVLERTSPARTPHKVRVSLHGDQSHLTPIPGMTVGLTGHLSAPEGAPEPGGFDFRRMAYFDQLGAIGYTSSPVMVMARPKGNVQVINRIRSYLSTAIMTAVPGDAGAFASGVMTGDRSGISLDTVEALRDSNLAHLLAISGMNMAFLTGFVFVLVRYGLALIPFVALRVNSKKVAALVAIGVAAFYLGLSGANVATERAFITVVIMLGAVLIDRRALTLRTVALAGCVVLIRQPETLLEPGFQMSFAATVALIAGFGAIEGQVIRERVPRWVMPIFTLVLSSVIAGLATAPFAAAHFNRMTDYGLIANLLTVPVMGAIVMPAGAIAALLAPFGLAELPLWVMEAGSRWILFVAHWIAGLDGAVTAVPTPPSPVLPILTLGALWLILFQGRARFLGAAPVALAFAMWATAERPALLISGDAVLVGLLGPEGRAMSSAKGAGFSADNWLENDGDLALQDQAAIRDGFAGPKGQRAFTLSTVKGLHLKGKGSMDGLAPACADGKLVILADTPPEVPAGCNLLDEATLSETGPLAIWLEGGELRVERTNTKRRLWSRAFKDVDMPDLLSGGT